MALLHYLYLNINYKTQYIRLPLRLIITIASPLLALVKIVATNWFLFLIAFCVNYY